MILRKEILRLIRVLRSMGLKWLPYRPDIPSSVDQALLIAQTADFFHRPLEEIQSHYDVYYAFHQEKGYKELLGERKTLCFEEAFLIYVAAHYGRPSQVVEIGTQHGKSTRRIVDILRHLKLDSRVICYDIVDQLQFVSSDEIQLVLQDVTDSFSNTVLAKASPSLIYLDAHPFMLLKNVISEFLSWSQVHPSILAIHDCGLGLYNPYMEIPKHEPTKITSLTGVWERHVLAEIFAVPSDKLDNLVTQSHHLRVFNTPHGLALIAPRNLYNSE